MTAWAINALNFTNVLVLYDSRNRGLLAPAAAVLLTLSGCSHPQGWKIPLFSSEASGKGEKRQTQRQIFIERVGESEIVA